MKAGERLLHSSCVLMAWMHKSFNSKVIFICCVYLCLRSTLTFCYIHNLEYPTGKPSRINNTCITHLAGCSSSSLLLLKVMSQPKNSVIVLQSRNISSLMGFYTLYWCFNIFIQREYIQKWEILLSFMLILWRAQRICLKFSKQKGLQWRDLTGVSTAWKVADRPAVIPSSQPAGSLSCQKDNNARKVTLYNVTCQPANTASPPKEI